MAGPLEKLSSSKVFEGELIKYKFKVRRSEIPLQPLLKGKIESSLLLWEDWMLNSISSFLC
jgi:hypothetical protein